MSAHSSTHSPAERQWRALASGGSNERLRAPGKMTIVFFISLSTGVARADAPVTDAEGPPSRRMDERPWTLGARLGYAWFLRSRSLAFEHIFKPSVQLGAGYRALPRLDVGVALGAVLDSDSSYGVWGAYGQARYLLVDGREFRLGAQLGLGLGRNAPILHEDLKASSTLSPYGSLGFDANWRLAGDAWLGLELASEMLSVIHLGAVMRWHL